MRPSNAQGVVTVDAGGIAEAKSVGQATITISLGKHKRSITLTVIGA